MTWLTQAQLLPKKKNKVPNRRRTRLTPVFMLTCGDIPNNTRNPVDKHASRLHCQRRCLHSRNSKVSTQKIHDVSSASAYCIVDISAEDEVEANSTLFLRDMRDIRRHSCHAVHSDSEMQERFGICPPYLGPLPFIKASTYISVDACSGPHDLLTELPQQRGGEIGTLSGFGVVACSANLLAQLRTTWRC